MLSPDRHPTPEFGSRSGTRIQQAAPLHYYVDNTVPGNDSANPTAARQAASHHPIKSSGGAYVEVHGAHTLTLRLHQIVGQGTAQSPIIIAGVGLPRFNQKLSVYGAEAAPRYMIFQVEPLQVGVRRTCHYIVLRNCDVHGDPDGGVSPSPASAPAPPTTSWPTAT